MKNLPEALVAVGSVVGVLCAVALFFWWGHSLLSSGKPMDAQEMGRKVKECEDAGLKAESFYSPLSGAVVEIGCTPN